MLLLGRASGKRHPTAFAQSVRMSPIVVSNSNVMTGFGLRQDVRHPTVDRR
jgi:hypothetical protein